MAAREVDVYRKIKFTLALLALVFTIGTFGFHFIEGWSFFEAFFMTLITVSTIGYGELHPLSQTGRYFDVVVIIMGVGTVATHPTRSVPSHSQIGCRMRLRGRPSPSTVATDAHTMA